MEWWYLDNKVYYKFNVKIDIIILANVNVIKFHDDFGEMRFGIL